MKTEPQHSIELTQLCKLIEPIAVAMLTTLDDDGALVSRPMQALEMDAQGAIWFFVDLRSSKVLHLRAANIAFADPDRSSFVSVSGRGEVDTNREHIQRLWTVLAKPWFPDGPESSHLGLLRFVPDRAEYWDAPHSKMVRMLAMAASAVTGQTLAPTEHNTLTGLSARSPDTSTA